MKTYKCLCCNKESIYLRQKSNKYCSSQCQADYQYTTRVNQWLNEGKYWTGPFPNWVRKKVKEVKGYHCEICGISEWNNNPITLELDHTDGDHTNNKLENLRHVCPNCHSQTDTYKNKNYGNGRQYRRKRYHDGKTY